MSTSAGRVLPIAKGDYNNAETYSVLDWVLYNGKPYVAKQTTTGNLPTDTTYWQLVVDNPTSDFTGATSQANGTHGLVPAPLTTDKDKYLKGDGTWDEPQGGHVIKDETTTFPQRKNLIFNGFYLEDDSTNNATIVRKNKPIPTWATGSDADIAEALQMHYAGEIDLHDYWSVGDERTVTLAAMEATGVGEAHNATTVTLVLMNAGGKTLADGTTECAFVVGIKETLTPYGYMNSTNTNSGGWRDCARRTWCNSVFYNAVPSAIRSIFKQFKNKSGTGGSSSSGTYDTTDYFALPAEIEVFGTTTYSVAGEGTQFKYYETAANRIKLRTDTQAAGTWWERSPYSAISGLFCFVYTSGTANGHQADTTFGLSPFGCI